jgi:hypothetical protein
MKKRVVYIPPASPATPTKKPVAKKPDSHTAPKASATSAKIEKPLSIRSGEVIPPKPKPQPVKTQAEHNEQSERDKKRCRDEILARGLSHKPKPIGKLGPIQFSRCFCGFTLAMFESRTYWIRVKSPDGREASTS